MKTYKEMAENVLRRRDEYEEKKEHRYGVVKRTAAIAVTVVFVLSAMIVGPIVGRIMKEQQNQPADGTKINTDTETTADQDTETTKTADVTTEVGETTGEIDETTEKNKYFLPIEYLPDPNPAITLEVTESSESSPFVRYYGYDKSEIKTYQMRYNNTTYFNSMSMNGEGSHGNYVKIIITSSENIEMLTDNYLVLEIPGATADFELSFKCINGATNGFFTIYWIEDTHDYYDEIDENTDIDAFRLELRKNGRKEYISRENRTYGFANVKGYDIFAKCETVDHIYSVVARYFGEVDANGVPLYLNDPYMPDYYDSLHSQNDRLIKEKYSTNEERSGSTDELESEQNRVSIFANGLILWSDEENATHIAQNLSVYLLDVDTNQRYYTTTNETGYYYITYPVLNIGTYHVQIYVEITGANIYISDKIDNAIITQKIYEGNLNSGSLVIASYTFNHSANNEKINKAISIHQSFELAQRYMYQLTGNYISDVGVWLTDDFYVGDDFLEAKYYHNYTNGGYWFYVCYKDAYEWDKIEYEFGQFIEDRFGIYFSNYPGRLPYYDLIIYFEKTNGIGIAWQNGWATFFAINLQRVMNASNMNIPYVGDFVFTDIENYCEVHIEADIESLTNLLDSSYTYWYNYAFPKGEGCEICIAAFLLDLVDGISTDDGDITCFNDTLVWNTAISNNGSKSLSDFINRFYSSTSFNEYNKVSIGYLNESYDFSSKIGNITVSNNGDRTITWTNLNTSETKNIGVTLETSAYVPIITISATANSQSLVIPAATWNYYTANCPNSYIYVFVQTFYGTWNQTGPYRSSWRIALI